MAKRRTTDETDAAPTRRPETRQARLERVLAEQFADFPRIDVLNRRLEDPELPGSLPIRLKDEPSMAVDPTGARRRWYLRWINTALPQRFHTATQAMGYVPVTWDELDSPDMIADRYEGAREVRRGDRGVEVLVKIPLPAYEYLKREQQRRRDARSKPAAVREELRQGAADAAQADPERFGVSADEAAHIAGGLVGDIQIGHERHTLIED
jgi:hypothetical protein